MLNLATCGARCVVKVSAGLFDSSGHGSVWFLWLSWAKSGLSSDTSTSELVYPQELVLLSWLRALLLPSWFILRHYTSELVYPRACLLLR